MDDGLWTGRVGYVDVLYCLFVWMFDFFPPANVVDHGGATQHRSCQKVGGQVFPSIKHVALHYIHKKKNLRGANCVIDFILSENGGQMSLLMNDTWVFENICCTIRTCALKIDWQVV